MKIQSTLAGSITHLSRTIRQRLTPAARRSRDRIRGHALLSAAIAVTAIGGAAALAVALPDSTHTTNQMHPAGTTHGPTANHLASPPAAPTRGTSGVSHTTSSPS